MTSEDGVDLVDLGRRQPPAQRAEVFLDFFRAAEADEPQKSIPKAVNQVIYRILIFYICSLAVLLSLYPWNEVAAGKGKLEFFEFPKMYFKDSED